jgi:hypothetical protein
MNFAASLVEMNQRERLPMPKMMLRVLLLMAAVTVAAGGFVIGACSYELDRAATQHTPH